MLGLLTACWRGCWCVPGSGCRWRTLGKGWPGLGEGETLLGSEEGAPELWLITQIWEDARAILILHEAVRGPQA